MNYIEFMPKEVKKYAAEYEKGKIKLNKERKQLIEYIEREIGPRLKSKELFFDIDQIEKCIGYIEKWFFKLENFQKFIIAFVFLYFTENRANVYREFLIMMGRGGGKNGLISGICSYLLTPMHGIAKYDISIVANSEEQAKVSFDEIYDVIEGNPALKKTFDNKKAKIRNRQTKSVIRYVTSNGSTKDGARDGAIIFDEIHRYESNRDVRVHVSGLGKRPNPRQFYIGTDGYVRDGFIDNIKDKAQKVLTGKTRFNSLFPFICKLDDERQVDELATWELANPMFHKPLSSYAKDLWNEVVEQYEELQDDPSNREEFMTKRMNLPVADTERSVASHDELVATKRDFPDLTGRQCIGAFDYAAVRDFASVGLLFKSGEDYVWMSHSFVRKEFVDATYGYSKPKDSVNGKRIFAPIKKWEEDGFLTVLDEPTISAKYIADWFVRMRDDEGYDLQTIVADRFRAEHVQQAFEAHDFEVQYKNKFDAPPGYRLEILRNALAIDSLVAPKVESAFASQNVIFGNKDMMRWYTHNVLRKIKGDGNVIYVKKEDVRRKTDGFKAFEYAMYHSGDLQDVSVGDFYDNVDDWF